MGLPDSDIPKPKLEVNMMLGARLPPANPKESVQKPASGEPLPDIFAEGQTLSRRQAVYLYNSWMAGLKDDIKFFLNIPRELGLESPWADGQTNLPSIRERRNACQFLRDMADKMDPDGTWASRNGASSLTSDLAQIVYAHGLSTHQVIQIIEAHLEKKAD